MKIIDGKKINQEIGERLEKEIKEKKLQPSLGILCVGDDKASLSFINVKKRFGERHGFLVNLYEMKTGVDKNEIIQKIREMEEKNDAVIVQLPLPAEFKADTTEILESINIKKDVDNLTAKDFYDSPIILSLEKVLPESFSKIAIVGMGKVVGLPVREWCIRKKIDYVEVGKENFVDIKDCDVVVAAVGVPYLIKRDVIKAGGILIDYGCSYLENKLYGDFDPECFEVAKKYTPVPGGMGPIVVACLFENVLKSFS